MLPYLAVFAFVAVVLGGKSPGAHYIEQFGALHSRYSDNILEDAMLDVPGLISKYGYPVEVHEVFTEDGYGLTMHRIPHGKEDHAQAKEKRPVVYLMHGLMGSSAEYVLLGPGSSLGYVLADAGYDVWIGNARGNYYSRRHLTLNPDSRRDTTFWRFSWDEIGNLDLPACLSHIENVTNQSKLHYVGHSQGCTNFFVLNSLRPEFNEKFISFQAMAPGVFFTHNESPSYQTLAPYAHIIEPAIFALTRGEVMRNRDWVTWFASRYCYSGSPFGPFCASIIADGMSVYFNQTMIPVFLGHSPAGASIRQFNHFAQGINHDTFRRFDHGPVQNLAIYGTLTPPDYDLTKVTAPTYLHYSLNDISSHWKDVEKLGSRLPNAELHKIDSINFDHLDFVWGSGVRWKLYEHVMALMKKAEQNLNVF